MSLNRRISWTAATRTMKADRDVLPAVTLSAPLSPLLLSATFRPPKLPWRQPRPCGAMTATACPTVHALTRRSLFGSAILLGPLLRAGMATPPDPMLAAIRLAEAADTAHRAAGLVSGSRKPGGVLTPEWRAERVATARARFAARVSLHGLTPTTRAEAVALVRYYADRMSHADPVNVRGASRAAQRRLREVFARPGAHPLDRAASASLSPSLPIPAD